ncbi:aromatic amino acid ammonia-lyase [Actinacidiphila sp. ITFR-21]|uniref:aromatic amino acid ammonia-lyase n=1 Tax=Actinacidiphila sp. ITFR-21 TaxID=3075199 RepID=UPI002889228E|nr:aromatic amino acid ammonia-lyase [Streptomyces sp. ITFR-21]WNI18938.1 aromatic amino acid ammonia-lyase [Streptomyces sp. ITFR-21]
MGTPPEIPSHRTEAPSAEGASVAPSSAGTDRVLLDGTGLDADAVARLADRAAVPAVPPEALERAAHSYRVARRLAATGRVYGLDTGVGANRTVFLSGTDQSGQELRLLRSHAAGAGAELPARHVRAMLAVRANQVFAGGSQVQPALAEALVEALRLGVRPAVNEYGGVGTADLTALAQTGLTVIGERPWLSGDEAARPVGGTDAVPGTVPGTVPPQAQAQAQAQARRPSRAVPAPVAPEHGDALAFMSSNALVLGQAALVCHDVDILLRASHAVAALSLAAVSGSLEAYAAPVHAVRPHPGAVRAAAEVRRLLGAPERSRATGGRIQDPFGFRVFPQVHGPALDAAGTLRRVLAVELNAPPENPLISDEGPDGAPIAYHHGGFFATPLGLALDQLCLALLQTGQLSTARLAAFGDPDITGLRSYLARGPAGSSGMMILEYSANSALAEVRASAMPASVGHAVLSRGLEEAASFASQAVRQALRAVDAYRVVLACELVAAVGALRQHPAPPPAAPVFTVLDADLPPLAEDRPLTADVTAAAGLLPMLAAL